VALADFCAEPVRTGVDPALREADRPDVAEDVPAEDLEALVDDALVDAVLEALGVDVRALDVRSAGLDSGCSPDSLAEAQARAASIVPAPIAAATGHSISPRAASRPSPP
jgi:hypothetical protein